MSDIFNGDCNDDSVDPYTAAKLVNFGRSKNAPLLRREIEFIARMGEILSDSRKLLASRSENDGTFISWASAELDLSPKTILNYVNAWDRLLRNGYTRYLHWSPLALYWASKDDLPKTVRKKLEELSTFDFVRASDVKRLIEASKPKPDPHDAPPFNAAPEMIPAAK